MARETIRCAERISTETLSAWRDEVLPAGEAARLRGHIPTCEACQERLADFEGVARALHRQRELEPSGRIVLGVQGRAARTRRPGAVRRRAWTISGLGAVAAALAVVVLFVSVLRNGPGRTTGAFVAVATSIPATPVTNGVLAVQDAAVAGEISFAYEENGDVWASVHGSPARLLFHADLPGKAPNADVRWNMVWSADQSKLLVTTASAPVVGQGGASSPGTGTSTLTRATPVLPVAAPAWVVSLPDGRVTQLHDGMRLVACLQSGVTACSWLGDRYIAAFTQIHTDPSGPVMATPIIFDTQAQRLLTTRLDGRKIIYAEARGSSLFFTSPPANTCDQGTIQRYDVASDSITTAFTLPVGDYSAPWDLSADGTRVLVPGTDYSYPGNGPNLCGHTPAYLLGPQSSTPMFTSHQAAASGRATQSVFGSRIAPDNEHAMILVMPQAVVPLNAGTQGQWGELQQEDVATGGQWTNAFPQDGVLPSAPMGTFASLGWTMRRPGFLVLLVQTASESQPPIGSAIYWAPVGSNAPVHLVETIRAPEKLYFAYPATFLCDPYAGCSQ